MIKIGIIIGSTRPGRVGESVEDFKRAFGNPEFQSKLGHYPAEASASPHLFQKVAMPRICVD